MKREIKIYIPETDVTFTLGEFIRVILLGIGICAAPFIMKALLNLIF